MMQQNEMSYVDALTDTYNRQYLNHILTAWISRNNHFAGVMLDMDDFKSINDNFGHSEGDNALKNVAAILKQTREHHEWVFRFAGDEFIILKMGTADDLITYMTEVKRRLDDFNSREHIYKLAISYGISSFDTGGVDTFMRDLDDKMYEMKATHHQPAARA